MHRQGMRFPPITVSCGQQVLFRQFSDGNVIVPMDNAERATVATALREILDLVEGEVTLPSFSTGTASNCLQQTGQDRGDHKSGAVAHLTELPDNRTCGYSEPQGHPHPNDN